MPTQVMPDLGAFCFATKQKAPVSMLSVEDCRKIIGAEMSDKEVEAVRDSLYALVGSVLDHFDTHGAELKTPSNHDIN